MLADELNLACETIKDGNNDESVVSAIELEWIEPALYETAKAPFEDVSTR